MDTDKMLARLEHLARRRVALEDEIDGLVGLLRAADLDGTTEVSWTDIGDALGVTRQAARQLYMRRWPR